MAIVLYAAVLGLMFIGMSVAVIRARVQARVALYDGGNETLSRRIRAHANFAEYTPLFLLLLFLAEQQGLGRDYVHVFGTLFVVGRILHFVSLTMTEASGASGSMKGRQAGMAATFGCIGTLAVLLLYSYFA